MRFFLLTLELPEELGLLPADDEALGRDRLVLPADELLLEPDDLLALVGARFATAADFVDEAFLEVGFTAAVRPLLLTFAVLTLERETEFLDVTVVALFPDLTGWTREPPCLLPAR